jgi:hypothetical protein
MSSASDVSQLAALGVDLATAGPVAAVKIRAVVAKGALNIKKDWQDGWKGLAHAPRLPFAISYDTAELVGGASAVIGPDKTKTQGALGNLLEFGSANSGPHPAGQAALDREEPRFLAALEQIAGEVL